MFSSCQLNLRGTHILDSPLLHEHIYTHSHEPWARDKTNGSKSNENKVFIISIINNEHFQPSGNIKSYYYGFSVFRGLSLVSMNFTLRASFIIFSDTCVLLLWRIQECVRVYSIYFFFSETHALRT